MTALQTAIDWLNDNQLARWSFALLVTLIGFLDDEPYHLIVIWAACMAADLSSRLWRIAQNNGGVIQAIRRGRLNSASMIRGVGDELIQLFVWSLIAWSITTAVPNNASFSVGNHKILIDGLVRSLPFAYLAIGDAISVAENLLDSEKGTKKQQFYHWVMETLVLFANALRGRALNTISGGAYTGIQVSYSPSSYNASSSSSESRQIPSIPEMDTEKKEKGLPPHTTSIDNPLRSGEALGEP